MNCCMYCGISISRGSVCAICKAKGKNVGHTPGTIEAVGVNLYATGEVCLATTHNDDLQGSLEERGNEAEANAARLALCWNSHDALVKEIEAKNKVLTEQAGTCSSRLARITNLEALLQQILDAAHPLEGINEYDPKRMQRYIVPVRVIDEARAELKLAKE